MLHYMSELSWSEHRFQDCVVRNILGSSPVLQTTFYQWYNLLCTIWIGCLTVSNKICLVKKIRLATKEANKAWFFIFFLHFLWEVIIFCKTAYCWIWVQNIQLVCVSLNVIPQLLNIHPQYHFFFPILNHWNLL